MWAVSGWKSKVEVLQWHRPGRLDDTWKNPERLISRLLKSTVNIEMHTWIFAPIHLHNHTHQRGSDSVCFSLLWLPGGALNCALTQLKFKNPVISASHEVCVSFQLLVRIPASSLNSHFVLTVCGSKYTFCTFEVALHTQDMCKSSECNKDTFHMHARSCKGLHQWNIVATCENRIMWSRFRGPLNPPTCWSYSHGGVEDTIPVRY